VLSRNFELSPIPRQILAGAVDAAAQCFDPRGVDVEPQKLKCAELDRQRRLT
jgi:hypothetical protein